MMVKIYSEKYYERGVIEVSKKLIYTVLLKFLYVTLAVISLFYRYMTKKLPGWVFEPNPYDTCIVKNKVGGKNEL